MCEQLVDLYYEEDGRTCEIGTTHGSALPQVGDYVLVTKFVRKTSTSSEKVEVERRVARRFWRFYESTTPIRPDLVLVFGD